MDLVNQIGECSATLDACVRDLANKGRNKAKAEADYRMALSQEILRLRDEKVPVTIISDICRGTKEIARLRFERDVSETLYEVVMQKIYTLKLQISILENQVKREWGGSS
jgi:hypothetical protein